MRRALATKERYVSYPVCVCEAVAAEGNPVQHGVRDSIKGNRATHTQQ